MRAINLYRCSTDMQDLKVQQETCRKFDKEKEFDIYLEIEEEDISGYKLSLNQRVGLLEILTRAENKEFDVLVIYMFDRLGRREDETPFIIQKLYELGIQVYTANDGQLIQANTMESKLINYFNSWVANYESVKTSIRVKNKIKSLNNEGEYTGGIPPYGYEVYQTGEIKPNGKVKYNIRICSSEAEIVKLIFNLCINKNYGSGRIATYLNSHGYKNRPSYSINENKERIAKECPFRNNSINRIIRNSIYIGQQRYNCHTSTQNKTIINPKSEWKTKPVREDLIIIDEDTFVKANNLMSIRKIQKGFEIKTSTKGKLLCSGIAYCHCGSKLKTDYSIKTYIRKSDGQTTKMQTLRYTCSNGRNNRKDHDGSLHFSGIKYDKYVEDTLKDFLCNIDFELLNKNVNICLEENITRMKQEIQNLNKEKDQCNLRTAKYQNELDKLVLSEDEDKDFKMKTFFNGMKNNENNIKLLEQKLNKLIDLVNNSEKQETSMKKEIKSLLDIRDRFDNMNFDEKKASIADAFKQIIFYKNKIQVIPRAMVFDI